MNEPKPINDGGPAFPMAYNETTASYSPQGMSLRDYFAGQVLNGKLSNPAHTHSMKRRTKSNEYKARKFAEYQATRAYQIADAMIAERNKNAN